MTGMHQGWSRRRFFGTCAAGVAASRFAAGAAGAHDRIHLAFIGTGGRGGYLLDCYRRMPQVKVLGVCDVDRGRLDGAAARAGSGVVKTTDYREILDIKDVDGVVVAPPDHWHAIPTLQAIDAGKDVFCEKPIGHNVREGRLIADAAAREKRVVQIGLQHRSAPHFIEAVRRIRAGELGTVSHVHAWNCWGLNGMGSSGPAGIGVCPDADPPEGVDYDRWLGPAPARRFNPRRFHFYFYFFWQYSGGMVSAWGVHLFDVVEWAMGSAFRSVTTKGGMHVYKDMRETPDTAEAVFEYPDYALVYSMRHGSGYPYHGRMDHGIMFFGTQAALTINRAGFEITPEGADRPSFTMRDQGMDAQHQRNFLECIQSRKPPAADPLSGHQGAIPGHLANIAYRVGRTVNWDAAAETIPGDPQAAALLTREYRAPYVL